MGSFAPARGRSFCLTLDNDHATTATMVATATTGSGFEARRVFSFEFVAVRYSFTLGLITAR
jgi:hypothetical protein